MVLDHSYIEASCDAAHILEQLGLGHQNQLASHSNCHQQGTNHRAHHLQGASQPHPGRPRSCYIGTCPLWHMFDELAPKLSFLTNAYILEFILDMPDVMDSQSYSKLVGA